jgi:microcin C transport system substrate-binding protein
MTSKIPSLLAALLAVAPVCTTSADQTFPAAGWKPRPDPLASPYAVVGGEITAYPGSYPKSFNYYLDNNTFDSLLMALMYDTLLDTDPITSQFEPCIAESWTLSDDHRTMTFRISPAAKWSDGHPVTAEDVAWTFDAIRAPENLTGSHKVSLEKFAPPEILSSGEVRFTCSESHWRNLLAIGGLNILPKHVFAGKDFNKINFEFPVVSGRYRLSETKEGIFARLERRADWWRAGDARVKNTGNFQTIVFRFFAENENAFEAFKKGMLDLFPVYTSHLWMHETSGERFEKNWVIKQKVHNYQPAGFQGFAMNLRRPPFDSLPVRKAMAYLLDRERMNSTLMYNQYFLHRSYFEDLYSESSPCPNPVAKFDPETARRLLSEAGWTANPKTGLLEKDGKPLSFTFLERSQASQKFLAVYGEALRNAGIGMKIEMKDWAAWSKDMTDYNFDMTWAAWGASIFKDPEGMWASSEAARPGGNNITGFKNDEVNRLIEAQRTMFDIGARNEVCRKIDQIVFGEFPYALLWNINYTRLLYWNKFGAPPTVLSKYGGEDTAYLYWWHDPDAAAELEHAMKSGEILPAQPADVYFDRVFKH